MVAQVQAITVRLPTELYERLRRQAYELHRPQANIIQTAVELYLAELETGERPEG